MAKLPQYISNKVSDRTLMAIDTRDGKTEFMQTAAAVTAGLAGQVGKFADRAASKEGQLSGMVAGLDPEFRPGRQNTIRGNAYDQAGIRTFLEQREAEMRRDMDEIAIANIGNPDGLTASLAEYEKNKLAEFEKGGFAEARVSFAGMFERSRTTLVRQAMRDKFERQRLERVAALESNVAERNRNAERAAYNNGLDEKADKVIVGELEATRRMLAAARQSGDITPTAFRRLMDEAEKSTAKARFIGAFDRLEGVEAKRKFLQDFEKNYREGKSGADLFELKDFKVLKSAMGASITRDLAQGAAQGRELNRRIGEVEARAADGLTPPRSEMVLIEEAAKAIGDPLLVKKSEEARQFVELTQQFKTQTPVQLENFRRQLELKMAKSGGTTEDRQKLKALDKVQVAQNQMLKNNPYAWGQRAGYLKENVQLVMTGDAATDQSLAKRLVARDKMRAIYGDIPFFTVAETEALKYAAETSPQQTMAFAARLITTLGKEAPEVLKEIADDVPVLVNMAGKLMQGFGERTSSEVIEAQKLRREPGYKPVRPKPSQMDNASREYFGAAYLANPKAQNAVQQEALLLFEKRAREQNIDPDFDNDEGKELWQKALDDAAGGHRVAGVKYGGVVAVNGVRTIAPSSMPAHELEQRVNRISEKDIADLAPIASGNGVKITAVKLQSARLVAVGDGRYRLALGDPQSNDPRYVMGKNGSYWVLDIRQLARLQQSRKVIVAPGEVPGQFDINSPDYSFQPGG